MSGCFSTTKYVTVATVHPIVNVTKTFTVSIKNIKYIKDAIIEICQIIFALFINIINIKKNGSPNIVNK
jgi:hypothetical protein